MSFTLLALAGCQSMPKVAQETPNQAFSAETESGEAQERLNQINFKQLKKEQNRPIIALVLGSGGARGYAHIGAIQVLEQSGIRPDFIVGTSAGSIVGSLYASGKNANQIRDIALNMKASDVRDIRLDMKGFFDGQKVEDYVNEQVSDMPLQSLPIPMYVVATQLKEGKKVVFNYGNTGQAVRASVSIPSMFIPTKIGADEYVDVPLGTVVRDTETDEIIFEITENGEEKIIAQGGKALEALNQACLELHKGADGVSKTWSLVHIKGQVEFSDSFGK